MIVLSERLTKLRNKLGITQAEMARRISVHRGTYSNYESGKRHPDYETLGKIANIHNVTIDYLMCRSDEPDLTEKEDQALTEEAIEYLKILESMPEEKRKEMKEKIMSYAEFLRSQED